MSDINFGGLATGLPTNDIVDQLMALERRPIDRLESKKAQETTRLEAYAQFDATLDDLKAAVGEMNLTSQVLSTSVKLSSEDAFTATSNGAGTGSYDVAVAQLAQVQKDVSDGWSSKTESLLGTGTLTVNGKVVTIDDDSNSLAAMAAAVNAVSDETGVTASIIDDGDADNPFRLVFTGKDASSSFTVTSDLKDELENPIAFNLTQAKTAQQAVAFIDGVKIVSDSNTLTGTIGGVTLNLGQVSSSLSAGTAEVGVDPWDWADPPVYQTANMTVATDTEALKEKVSSFVSSYNKVMDWISEGYATLGSTATAATAAEGEEVNLSSHLRGDATINSVKRGLQSVLSTAVETSGAFNVLAEIGITTQRDGSFKLDNTKLDEALTENFDDVVKLLVGEGDVDGAMKNFNYYLLDATSSSDGMYANKKNSYKTAASRIDSQILRMEPLLEKRELTLRARFTAMETLISGMNAQSSFLTQQMDILNNMSSGN